MGEAKDEVASEATWRTRSEAVGGRVRTAVAELEAEGAALSFYSVAQRARVARSTLYRREDLRLLIAEARGRAMAQEPNAAQGWGVAQGTGGSAASRAAVRAGEPSFPIAGRARSPGDVRGSSDAIRENKVLRASLKQLQEENERLVARLAAAELKTGPPHMVYGVCRLAVA